MPSGDTAGHLGVPSSLLGWGGRILEVMTTSSGARRRHLASSPFKPDPEQTIEQYAVGDMVSHDSYGMGRVVGLEGSAVTVNFGSQTVRVTSPFNKMSKL